MSRLLPPTCSCKPLRVLVLAALIVWTPLYLAWSPAAGAAAVAPSAASGDGPPPRLSDTGLYADVPRQQLAAGVARFSPQYPLWSDGAAKERFVRLPPGTTIDASNPDAWVFPSGSKFWKTFLHAGRPIETRLIEHAGGGGWRYATYVWRADGSDADLAGAERAMLEVPAAPMGRYALPSRADCLACHAGATVPVLGFGALQLSPVRDPLAAHGGSAAAADVDLPALVASGLVRGLPPRLLEQPPRIAARSAGERAALGYLHGNCAQCHHANPGRVPLRLNLMQRVADPEAAAADVLRSLIDAPSRYQGSATGGAASDATSGDSAGAEPRIVVPGDAAKSTLVQRLASRDPRVQMPPLATEHTDSAGLALVKRWIERELSHHRNQEP